jgi:hypothetical protein
MSRRVFFAGVALGCLLGALLTTTTLLVWTAAAQEEDERSEAPPAAAGQTPVPREPQGRSSAWTGPRYEYCAVQPGSGRIWMLTERGAHSTTLPETIGSGDWARAVTVLGDQGWEMVATGSVANLTNPSPALYFKRQKR